MSCCSKDKDFLKDLEHIKAEMEVWGFDYEIMEGIYRLKQKIKEFFPMNKVPEDLYYSLHKAEERFKIACEQLNITCEMAILEIEKIRDKDCICV